MVLNRWQKKSPLFLLEIMKLRFAIHLVAAALLAPALDAQELKPLTVDALVAKNIEAKGGIDALRAVKAVRFTGKMLVNQGQIELPTPRRNNGRAGSARKLLSRA